MGVAAANLGRTAGELVGLAPRGPAATNDVEALIAQDADCVIYMPAEPTGRLTKPGSDGWRSVDPICRLLASGKNVVATGVSGLTNPKTYGAEVYERLRTAAESG